MKKIPLYIFTATLFSTLFVAEVAFGQTVPGTGVNVSTNPRNPSPGDSVTISIESFSTDLNRAVIRWDVNGALYREGLGVKNIVITAPGVGSSAVVNVSAKTDDIGPISKRIVISPAEVELFQQSESYTPPFYKGRALSPLEGDITMIAMPNLVTSSGVRLSSPNLVFKWKRNGRVLGNDSGVGKNTLTVEGPRLSGERLLIEVEVSSPENNLTASRSYSVQVANPEIVFYESNPLLGESLHRAISGTYALDKDELTLVAYPYFFDKNILNNFEARFSWRINGVVVSPTEASQNIIALRKPEGPGVSVVSFKIENTKKLFEVAQKSLRINFNSDDSGL